MFKEVVIKAVNDALANLGPKEYGGENRGDYVKTYLKEANLPEGYAWCACFVKYRLRKAHDFYDKETSDAFKKLSGWVPDWVNWARKNKIWIPLNEAMENPSLVQKGYLVCFWSKTRGRHFHIGFLYRKRGKHIEVIEGNTDQDKGRGSIVPDGDGVYVKKRLWTSIGENGGFIKLY